MKKILVCLLCLSLFAVTACQSQESSQEISYPLTNFELYYQNRRNAKNVYLIVKNAESSYWKTLIQGAKDACEELGLNLYVGGTTNENDDQGQMTLLKEARKKADAVILAPNNSRTLVDDVANIYQDGKPMILVDTMINSSQYSVCFMTDNVTAGRYSAQEMIRWLKQSHSEDEKLEVGIFLAAQRSQTLVDRLAGFNEYWANYAPKNWHTIDDIFLHEGSVEKATELCVEMFEDYDNVQGIYGANASATQGIIEAINQEGRDDVVFVGFDCYDSVIDYINDANHKVSIFVQEEYQMGYRSVYEINNQWQGINNEFKYIDTSFHIETSEVGS